MLGKAFTRVKGALKVCFLIGLAVVLGILLWRSVSNILTALELESLSFRQRLFSLPPKSRFQVSPITIVGLDNKTSTSDQMRRLFGIPMSRTASALFVRFTNRTKPRAVIFDLSYNGGVRHQDLAGDKAFVDSLQGPNHIASVLYFEREYGKPSNFGSLSGIEKRAALRNSIHVSGLANFPQYSFLYTFERASLPFPDLFAKSRMKFYSSRSTVMSAGSVKEGDEESEDKSGDGRRWSPLTLYGGYAFPTLPLGAVLNHQTELKLNADGRLSWKGGSLDLGPDLTPLIKWYGHGVRMDKPVYPEVSFWDVLVSEMVLECGENPSQTVCNEGWLPQQPLIMPEQFKNRYVVVGDTIRTSDDVHKTIYGLRYSGVYIVANILDNVLHNDFVLPAPGWVNLSLILLGPLLLAVFVWRFRSVWVSLLITLCLSLLFFSLGVLAYNRWDLWINTTNPILTVVLAFVGIYLYRYWQEQKQRQQLRYAFGKYVSPAVMQWIEVHPESLVLGGERREMAFLFCDIRGFTTYADTHPPEEVQAVLSSYFSVMNKIILQDYQGSINKLMGDAIMAYWGFPLENPDQAYQAVSAAIAMVKAIHDWRQQPGNPPLDIGVGIHIGEAMVGNVGSEEFMDFTVIGDAVNIASRLESANKELKTHILISQDVAGKLDGRIPLRSLGAIQLRGKEGKIQVYEPEAMN